jgi:hypothetical protein
VPIGISTGAWIAPSGAARRSVLRGVAIKERYTLFGERAPTPNALGQSTYEGVHFLAALLAQCERRGQSWLHGPGSELRYCSAPHRPRTAQLAR